MPPLHQGQEEGWVRKVLAIKCEDPMSIPRTHRSIRCGACNPHAGEARTGGSPGLADHVVEQTMLSVRQHLKTSNQARHGDCTRP